MRFYTLVFSVLIALTAAAQPCDNFLLQSSSDKSRITVSASREVSKRDFKKRQNEIKESIKSELRLLMAEKLMVEVRTSTVSTVSESQGVVEQYFTSETAIYTTASMASGDFDFCVDDVSRLIYGVYSLDRYHTAKATLSDCESRMSRINQDLEALIAQGIAQLPESIEQRYRDVKRDMRMAIYLQQDLELHYINLLFSDYDRKVEKLYTAVRSKNFSDQLTEVEGVLRNKDFVHGIDLLRKLQADFPGRGEVENLYALTLDRYRRHNENEVANLMARREYPVAMETMDEYCSVVSCTSGDYSRIAEIRSEYFTYESKKLDESIRLSNSRDAALHMANLRNIASADPKRYRQAEDAYNNFVITHELKSVQRELNRQNYKHAWFIQQQIEATHGTSNPQIQSMHRTAQEQLIKSEVRTERNKRRMCWSFAPGVEVFTNEIRDFSYFNDKITQLTTAYSGGLYRKFNYQGSGFNKYYTRRSDIIGIKARFTDWYATNSVTDITDEVWKPEYRWDMELLIDGTLGHFIHYAFGIMLPDFQWQDELMYTADIGLRLPLGPFALQAGVRSMWGGNGNIYAVNAGLFYHFDFGRDFNKQDRKAVIATLGF